jgi:hypothetical protein
MMAAGAEGEVKESGEAMGGMGWAASTRECKGGGLRNMFMWHVARATRISGPC